MSKVIVITIAVFCLFSTITLYTQENKKFQDNPAVKFLIKEKMKISPEDALKVLKGEISNIQQLKTGKKDILNSDSEVLVSDDILPESEIHAAINPNDSNNIIISPIRLGSDFSDLISCPVYYTKNFGQTWLKSDFKNKSKRDDLLVVGGGDPVLIYDNDGTAYLTWILMLLKFSGDSVYNSMNWAYSNDGGVNWKRQNDEFVAYTAAARGGGSPGLIEFYDKQWMAADNSNSQFKNNI